MDMLILSVPKVCSPGVWISQNIALLAQSYCLKLNYFSLSPFLRRNFFHSYAQSQS